METSFCELKGKEVINIVDGKKLGRIIDIVFDTNCGRMLGIVVPSYNKSWNIFKQSDDIFIPWGSICKFGDDARLVQIFIPNQKDIFAKKGRFVRTASHGETRLVYRHAAHRAKANRIHQSTALPDCQYSHSNG